MLFLDIYKKLEDQPFDFELEARGLFKYFNEKYKYFSPDDEIIYGQFFNVARVFFSDSDEEQYRFYSEKTPYNIFKYAYKFMIFFSDKDIESSLSRYDKFQSSINLSEVGPQYSIYEILTLRCRIPICMDYTKPNFDLKGWKEKLLEFGPEVLLNTKFLPKIELCLGRLPENKEEFSDILPSVKYQRAVENPQLAKLSYIHKLDEQNYNFVLDYSKKISLVDHPQLPNIVIDLGSMVPEYFEPTMTFANSGKLSLKARLGHNFRNGEEIEKDFYDRSYLVMLPRSNPRYFVKILDEDFTTIPSAVYPRPHGIYSVVKFASDKVFDPENIDWDNLENDGHKILGYFCLNQGYGNEFHMSVETYIPNFGAFISRILGDHFSRIFPSMEVIYNQCLSKGEKSYIDSISYVPDELYELRMQVESILPENMSIFLHEEILVSCKSQAKKILELGEEYIKSLKYINKLLTKFVLDECENISEIKELHTEILLLAESNPDKFELIFNIADKAYVTSNISYRAISIVPTEILEFLNSHNFLRYNIRLEDLLEGAVNLLDVKKKFIKICCEPFARDKIIFEKIDMASEEVLDVILECDNIPKLFRYINFDEVTDLDLPFLKLLFSEQTSNLYHQGINFKDLLASDDITKIKQNILMANVRPLMQQNNESEDEILEILSAISRFTIEQLNFLDDCDCYIIEMVKFIACNDDANTKMLKRKFFEKIYSKFQIVEDGLLKDISDEMAEALNEENACYFVNFGYTNLETLIKLPASLIREAVSFSMINIYNEMNSNIEELFSAPNPYDTLQKLKSDYKNIHNQYMHIIEEAADEHNILHHPEVDLSGDSGAV